MIIDRILGNVHDDPGPAAGREPLHVPLDDVALRRRVQRIRLGDGREVGLRLPAGHPGLRDGDVLLVEGERAHVVAAELTDVIVIRPRDLREMGETAHALGNRHLPAQFGEREMVVPADRTVAAHLKRAGVPWGRERRVLPRPFRHAEHVH